MAQINILRYGSAHPLKIKKMHLFHDSVVAEVPYRSSDDNLLTNATSPNTCNERGNGTVVTWRRK